MAVKRITRRWLFNSFGVILVILTAIIIVAAFGVRGYYYQSVRQAVISRANAINTLLVRYSEDSSVDYRAEARRSVTNFEAKNQMELMVIDQSGSVIITSSGFAPVGKMDMPDYVEALQSISGSGEYMGTINGESVLAMTFISPVDDEDYAAMRYLVSLTEVDNQIVIIIACISLIGAAIIFFVAMSSSYFINSIVRPLGQVKDTAAKIAQGDFNARLSSKTKDEIGELCGVINHMADELKSSERLKNEFISSVSHELRTPLTAIKGWAETLLPIPSPDGDVLPDTDTLRKGLSVVINETERLSSMVEELLDFSRLQSGRMTITPQKLDIAAELAEAVIMFTERARQEGIELNFTECDDILVVNGDKNRLRQIFVNILDNALKYSDSGGTVNVYIGREQHSAVIKVQDTGCGISAKDLLRVKERFYKANSTRRGSGIGLAVADELVNMHGGQLDIESEENTGTTVTITLPLSRV